MQVKLNPVARAFNRIDGACVYVGSRVHWGLAALCGFVGAVAALCFTFSAFIGWFGLLLGLILGFLPAVLAMILGGILSAILGPIAIYIAAAYFALRAMR